MLLQQGGTRERFLSMGIPKILAKGLVLRVGDVTFEVTAGLNILQNKTYVAYGEAPDQDKIYTEGDAYLKREFPLITHIKKASLVGHPGC
ncbi:hypothetical protein DYB28_013948 [Aphanomyces astaci]|uniref:Uncharacterized protein n=1 Tax=Aphanomyces astaci TaxID=112090 RepID=A0A397B187_APHAT|nr:hypothetical protein DYB36_002176 [Aphanomyces astaci]RHY45755.1 hypothetical protein DYB38_010727 [Aphanomyces astaci]RHY78248.1 hypothetical protein DYB34_000172 [Aphanomyces astaci]RHZ19919.1 hypothetical protein DYB31_004136 [Aphanomyces astaci]RHZ38364.1 hypothetical protein DYB26_013352 [Aphanomyces astaci]